MSLLLRSFAALIIAFSTSIAVAQNRPIISVSATPNRSRNGENIQFKISVTSKSSGRLAPPSIEGLADWEVVNFFRSESPRVTYVNGQVQYQYKAEYSYFLRPLKTGILKIPPINLTVGQETFKTDMDGMKHLPKPIKALPGAKPLENAWLDAGNMQLVLNGDEPASFIKESELFCGEARVGIERDNGKRMVNDGMLYFTRHVRLKEDISLGMVVSGADDVMPAGMVRLGGEGRMAHLKVADIVDSRLHGNDGKSDKFVLILLTHGDFLGKSEPALAGINMISACIGKAVREGGWDYKHNRPKPLKSLVPAGSCYFVEGDEQAIRALHGKHIGKRTAFGYGEIAVGIWREGEQQ